MPHDTTIATVWRERIQLNHTVKEGWRVGEATLEVTYQDGYEPLDIERLERLNDVVVRGQEVAASLNTSAGGDS